MRKDIPALVEEGLREAASVMHAFTSGEGNTRMLKDAVRLATQCARLVEVVHTVSYVEHLLERLHDRPPA